MRGKIAEVFDSIQGEGLYLGEKQIFVRFYGCNLGCKFCDTKISSFMEYEPEELFEELKLYQDRYHSVSFTGGEPLLQKDFLKEMLKLTRKGNFRNYLETNGTLHEELKEIIDYVDIIAMDLKLPSSTGLNDFWQEHRLFLETASRREVFLKAVISRDTQEEDLRRGLRLMRETAQGAVLVLQPDSNEDKVHLRDKLAKFKELCRQERVTVCLVNQIHKVIGVR
ncbi:MAG: 7-carboxy-7-deazaguanine synthase QueE [Candidatus Omnitrophica bacterium]|nr:7-carboxy-7-deazaguanine synthase QueE [Candidatus Omnitrophota bacterium]